MPRYTYTCKSCGHEDSDVWFHSYKDRPKWMKCPECGKRMYQGMAGDGSVKIFDGNPDYSTETSKFGLKGRYDGRFAEYPGDPRARFINKDQALARAREMGIDAKQSKQQGS